MSLGLLEFDELLESDELLDFFSALSRFLWWWRTGGASSASAGVGLGVGGVESTRVLVGLTRLNFRLYRKCTMLRTASNLASELATSVTLIPASSIFAKISFGKSWEDQ